MKTIMDIAKQLWDEASKHQIAMDAVRYSALRRLGPDKFKELHQRNLAGENFDDMVTQLAVDWANDKV
jgi:hypothetical protein